MRLVYKETQEPVQLGDIVSSGKGTEFKVQFFREPHSPASSGKVSVIDLDYPEKHSIELYTHVFGMGWIDREDRTTL